MEKRKYITPNIKVRKVTPHTILAGSDVSIGVSSTETTSEQNAKQVTCFDWSTSNGE